MNPDEEFLVKQSRGTLRHLGFKVTRKAIERACEVAEVSNEYMKFAAGYLATEVRQLPDPTTFCYDS